MNLDNECFVKDIYAASFLLVSGKRLLRLQKENSYYWFVFEGKNESEELLNVYWQGDGAVKPRIYADACRTLKDRVFAQR